MTDKKTYRTHWTIEEIDAPYAEVQWYKHQIDMDNVHYCSSVEEAEREIDDAIILEQEQIIDKFRDALMYSTAALIAAKSTLELVGCETDILPQQITENEQLIKSFQS